MNIGKKIALLLASIIISIGAILFFAKTRVQPPDAMSKENQYAIDLDDSLDSLRYIQIGHKQDVAYRNLYHKITLYVKEGKTSKQDADKSLHTLLNWYVEAFGDWSLNKLRNCEWESSDLYYMVKTISILENTTDFSTNNRSLSKSQKSKLYEISLINNRYNDAIALANNTGYKGIQGARDRIRQASNFLNDDYLSNCNGLVYRLKNLRTAIERSHYRFLNSEIEKLGSCYYHNSENDYSRQINKVKQYIETYRNNAESLYGIENSLYELIEKGTRYVNNANEYYDRKKRENMYRY